MSETEAWIEPTLESRPFFDAARAGVLRIQQCSACNTWMYPLKTRCQHCGSAGITWADTKGRGTIYAHAMLHREYHPRHAGRTPLVIAWIDLDEGVRIPSNIVGSQPGDLKAGMRVHVTFEHDPAGTAIPVFEVST